MPSTGFLPLRWKARLVAGLILMFLAGCKQHPFSQTHTFTEANVKRGEYLAQTYTCQEGHTVRLADGIHLNKALLFAGGEPFPGSDGSFVYSPNVTISSQYPAQVLDDTIRGRLAYKYKMPTGFYNGMAADDMRDIVAYIKTLQPILNHPLPDDYLPADYIVPAINPSEPVPQHQPPVGTVERGRYLSRMLVCQDCHSPRNAEGGYIDAQLFQGGGLQIRLPDGHMVIAPKITPDRETGIGAWSDDDILRVLRTGVTPKGRQLDPAMPSLSAYYGINDQDARDIIKFLRSLPPAKRSWKSVQVAAQEKQ